MNLCVIRFGNHWRLRNPVKRKSEWTDLAHATRHTPVSAHRYQQRMRAKGKRVEVYTLDEALKLAQKATAEKIKTDWMYAFWAAVHKAYGDRIPKDGVWVNAHMYHGQGLTVRKAVVQVGKSYGISA